MKSIKNFIFLSLLLITFNSYANLGPESESGYQKKPLVSGQQSMIVTNNKWATFAARQMLMKGGNAFDAAIAAGFVLGLTEPQSSGIGGGGYALTYSQKDHRLLSYDGREVAPHSVTPDWFYDENGKVMDIKETILTPQSIGVPSEVALFKKLHENQGKLPWETLLQPAIQLAEKGFPLSPRLHKLLTTEAKQLIKSSKIRAIYFNGKQVKAIGSTIKNPAYANTLRMIAKNPDNFYKGKLAESIIADINKAASKKIYNQKDFSHYHVIIKPAICLNYRENYRICSIPPSSSGGLTVLELLGIYANLYQGKKYDEAEWMYYFFEAGKLAFADRNQYLADPSFVKQPVSGLLDKQYLRKRSQLVTETPLKIPVAAGIPDGIDSYYAPDQSEKLPGTTSIAIVDKDGNAISMTVTVEHQFGSQIFTHGFFLNNELTDFSPMSKNEEGKWIANRIEPGKRPRSSMSPMIVFDKQQRLYALTGSPGGSDIICYVAKNLILMLDMGMMPDKASATPNLCVSNTNSVIEENRDVPQIAFLEKKDKIARTEMISGLTNILKSPKRGWLGAADPRREGLAFGE